MGTSTAAVLVVLLLVVIGGVVFAIALARRGRAQLAATDVGRDDPSGVPRAWAGGDSPEAALHRRLSALAQTADALTPDHAATTTDDAFAAMENTPAEARRIAVQQRIEEMTRLLVAVARAPESARRDAVAVLTPQVDAADADLAVLVAESRQP